MMNEFAIAGYMETEEFGILPILDIPMMSDETWNRLAAQNAKEREELERR